MLKMLLRNLSVAADTAEDGQTAVEMALCVNETGDKENYYDVIFMDNFMPVMVGQRSLQITVSKC